MRNAVYLTGSYGRMMKKVSKIGPRNRRNTGTSLAEILVALFVGSLLAGIFLDIVGQLMRLRTATQNEMSANAIAQEMIENTKALGYSYLNAHQGTTELLINLSPATPTPPADIKPSAVQLDFTKKKWSDPSISTQFKGTATYNVQMAPGLPNALQAKITVRWFDGRHLVGRTVTTSTILTKSGINKWEQ